MRDIQYLSIFGEADAAAQAMVSEGLAMWIAADRIPEGVLYNDSGDRARFAIAIHRSQMRAFKTRIAKAKKGPIMKTITFVMLAVLLPSLSYT